ncbi:LOB domain-containing protein 36 [Glycine soja]|uniref:LOB domain-containing protein 36 n=1 Tax=Glycine soja TaxID=3848 RepID=A0A445K7R7_GLYSO|nr:LOB domain-containing protein 36 [Glycine soja]
MSSSSNSPCAACKIQRRKCTQECVFAPYFPPDNPQRFAYVHKVFGASNVAKLLNELNAAQREDAVKSLAYEAEARLRDPVYGCVGLISILQHRLKQLQNELHHAKKELASHIGSHTMLPPAPSLLPPEQQPRTFSLFPFKPASTHQHDLFGFHDDGGASSASHAGGFNNHLAAVFSPSPAVDHAFSHAPMQSLTLPHHQHLMRSPMQPKPQTDPECFSLFNFPFFGLAVMVLLHRIKEGLVGVFISFARRVRDYNKTDM